MNLEILFTEDLPGGSSWSWIVRRHTTLRVVDVAGGANTGLLAYHAAQPLERLNLPDTLKAQYTAKLTRGHTLMSDMGRVLFSITSDTVGWHDPLGGHGNAAARAAHTARGLIKRRATTGRATPTTISSSSSANTGSAGATWWRT